MRTGQCPLWPAPVCCAIGFAAAYSVVSSLPGVYEQRRRLARTAAEIGVVPGLFYWYLALRPEAHATPSPVAALSGIAFSAIIWSVVAWPFAMWELERRLSIPYDRSYDVTTRMCGTTLLLFLVVTGVRRVLAFL
jgi:cellulose synthase/poly-beta-1,6-N-acetylglucosamine synthase-like glycosyltransferase